MSVASFLTKYNRLIDPLKFLIFLHVQKILEIIDISFCSVFARPFVNNPDLLIIRRCQLSFQGLKIRIVLGTCYIAQCGNLGKAMSDSFLSIFLTTG